MRLNRMFYILAGVIVLVVVGCFLVRADEIDRPEVRALWVDAFHDGCKTPDQVDQLIQSVLNAHINTLIVQVRRRGDAYYNHSIEPRTEDPVLPPGFDALQYLIEQAHLHQIEVHAWLNTLVAWNSLVSPQAPNHIWNLHGPQATDQDTWVSYYRTFDKSTSTWSGKLTASYYLDPGNPEVVDYTADVYVNVVKNYDVDGIHLDYTRYAGMGWGYNPTAVARFNAIYGKNGLPEPEDSDWAQWRREQTANLVRKIYLKAIAVKPQIKVSSAVITWGGGPVAEEDWEKTRAYSEVFQDWRGWLREGIVDMVMPMNYFNEWNSIQQTWYNQWIEWEKNHQYGRQIVVGPGIFPQYLEQSLDQIRRAQAPSMLGNYPAGIALYAYGATNLYSNSDYENFLANKALPRQPHQYLSETNEWLFYLLSKPGVYLDPVWGTYIPTTPVFPSSVNVPDMPWKSSPQTGYIIGKVAADNGKIADRVKVTVESISPAMEKIRRTVYTDGSGWYGVTELPPGQYRIAVDSRIDDRQGVTDVTVIPGRVVEANLGIVRN